MYGYKNVKWVTQIEVQPHLDHIGYWELRGYDEDAWVDKRVETAQKIQDIIRRTR